MILMKAVELCFLLAFRNSVHCIEKKQSVEKPIILSKYIYYYELMDLNLLRIAFSFW